MSLSLQSVTETEEMVAALWPMTRLKLYCLPGDNVLRPEGKGTARVSEVFSSMLIDSSMRFVPDSE